VTGAVTEALLARQTALCRFHRRHPQRQIWNVSFGARNYVTSATKLIIVRQSGQDLQRLNLGSVYQWPATAEQTHQRHVPLQVSNNTNTSAGGHPAYVFVNNERSLMQMRT
jgi:hypothetical protein